MGAQDHDAWPATWDCEVPAPEHRISGRLRARQFGTKKNKRAPRRCGDGSESGRVWTDFGRDFGIHRKRAYFEEAKRHINFPERAYCFCAEKERNFYHEKVALWIENNRLHLVFNQNEFSIKINTHSVYFFYLFTHFKLILIMINNY